MAHRSWNSFSPGFRAALIGLAVVEGALLLAAQVDITRRPSKAVAGSKTAWRMISFIELFGPIAYFVFGRVDPKQRKRRRPLTRRR